MSDQSALRLFLMRLAFLILAILILIFHLLPLETFTRFWAAPDLLLSLAFAWSLRRPDYVPALLLAAVFLLADLLLQRPPGLWALCALVACEYLKMRSRSLRDRNFLAEWGTIALVMVAIMLANRFILALVFVPNSQWQISLFAVVISVLCYPLVVALNFLLLGIRKSAPGDLDAKGQRI